jgi:oligopeptide/dipeptide ABC transporter ATP-binding protein
LVAVGVGAARRRLAQYPHQLSGGLRQRVMIAMAIACRPKLLIADEPTTALDVTIQAQILRLLVDLKERLGSALMLITHDLGVVAAMADQVVVMYAGRVVERASVGTIFSEPRHPYTMGLLGSVVRLEDSRAVALKSISGTPPVPLALPPGCSFRPRCPRAFARCAEELPVLAGSGVGHAAACHLVEAGRA